MNTKVLHPFSKVPQPQKATILVIGVEGTQKKQFAESLLRINVPYLLQIRTASYLPLPEDKENTRPNIDFIAFLLDMNNSRSLTSVHDSLKHLDASYFLGRVCFIVSQANHDTIHCTDLTDVTRLCDSVDSPMLSINFEVEEDCTIVARQVLQMLEIAAGMKPGVLPLLVQATGQSYQYVSGEDVDT